jgi:beta-glucuronidase
MHSILRVLPVIPCLFFAARPLLADPALANVYDRHPVSLNGQWRRIVDPYETGYSDYRGTPYDTAAKPTGGFFLDRRHPGKSDLVEYSFDTSPTLNVPGDWNSQDERLFYYEGSVWYRRLFDCPAPGADKRRFVYFAAANYETDVYLNGKKLGKHIGGFTPFSYEITGLTKEKENSLVVRVNNRRHVDGVPTTNTDWWNYGGITRDVLLVETPKTYLSETRVGLKKGDPKHIEAHVKLDGPQLKQSVRISIPEAHLEATATTGDDGTATVELPSEALALWSPENPRLYQVDISCDSDRSGDRIGFRTIETRGADILLNGKPVFLRGICIHEENPLRGGRAYSRDDAKQLLGYAKELNCNFVRLAHYPHNEFMARLADELGIMVWEEIPVYWTIQWENKATLKNATTQLSDLITRDQNRASVVVWSVANETPVSDARTRFLKTLVDTARTLDGTRLVSAAMEVHNADNESTHKVVDDPFSEFTDLISFNQYAGWYDGTPDKIDKITWTIKADKPVFISEFGADALQGFHADAMTRFSEEYQEAVYRKTIVMLRKIPQFRGTTPWILCDFRSPRRLLPMIQEGWNRKGLIGENGKKKKAFAVLKEFYDQMSAK